MTGDGRAPFASATVRMKRRLSAGRVALGAFVLSLVAASAMAAEGTAPKASPDPKSAPAAASPPDAKGTPTPVPDTAPRVPVEQYQLENGLTVLLSEDHRLPVVATEVLYLVGSGHERQGRTGFAHLFEHLMFQGSEHHDREYFAPFEPIGASVNGTTSADRTNFFERVPSNYLELSLWMESDRMRSLLPVLDQTKLDNQRDVVKNERRQRYEIEPYGMAFYHMGEALYPESHPYHHDTIGSHEDLTAATLDDVRGFFKQYYGASNAVLSVVGDFDRVATKALIHRYFGDVPAGARQKPPDATMPTLPGIVHWVSKDDVELPRIYLAWHSPSLYAKGDAELDLLSSVLTDGKTSRLFQPLVYEQKVAKDVAAFQASERLSSQFVIMVTAAPGVTIDQLYAAVEKALKKALATEPTARELERAQNTFKKGFYQRIEASDARASMLANYYLHTGRADFLAEDLARYVQATPKSVHEAASRYLDPKRFVRLDFVPGGRGGPPDKRPVVAATPNPTTQAPSAAPTTTTPAPPSGGADKAKGGAK